MGGQRLGQAKRRDGVHPEYVEPGRGIGSTARAVNACIVDQKIDRLAFEAAGQLGDLFIVGDVDGLNGNLALYLLQRIGFARLAATGDNLPSIAGVLRVNSRPIPRLAPVTRTVDMTTPQTIWKWAFSVFRPLIGVRSMGRRMIR